MFTKQHYEAIAKIMSKEYNTEHTQSSQYNAIVDRMADYFQSDNPNFQRDKFIKACYK